MEVTKKSKYPEGAFSARKAFEKFEYTLFAKSDVQLKILFSL